MRYDSWIRSLENDVAELRAEVRDLKAKEGLMARGKQTRLAITVENPDTGDYAGGKILEIVSLDCSSPGCVSITPTPTGSGNVFDIVFVDASYTETAGQQDVDIKDRQLATAPIAVARCLDTMGCVPVGTLIDVFWHNGQWWFAGKGNLVGIKLAVNHPGQGILFDVWLGTWNPKIADYDYDEETTYQAIDLRYDVPYPAKCATGLAEWRPYNPVTVDEWFQPASEPVRTIPSPLPGYWAGVLEPTLWEVPTMDTWFQPLSEPARLGLPVPIGGASYQGDPGDFV